MVDMKVLATRLRFPEGPVALADGSIALVEIARGTVSRVTPDGKVTVIADLGGGPNGLAFGPDGALYVCNNGGFEWHEEPSMLRPIGQPKDYSGGRIERGRSEDGPVAPSLRPLRREQTEGTERHRFRPQRRLLLY
jgi:gluconolactonase